MRGRARSKRISEHESDGGASNESARQPADARPDETLREALDRVGNERDRVAGQLQQAERDLSTANRRLEDAASVRRHLLENVAAGGDEARRRFASALHDDALQLLTGAELQLERIRTHARSTKYAGELDELTLALKRVEDSLRNILSNVSPAGLDPLTGLDEAIHDRLTALKVHTGIEPEIDLRIPRNLSAAAKLIAFKNVSEALSNVEKHANATRVSVRVEAVDGGLSVEIADDGTGFLLIESRYLPGHLGLVAMRERAQLAGGWCRYDSEPGAGTRVTFWIPDQV